MFLFLVVLPIADNIANLRSYKFNISEAIKIDYSDLDKKIASNLMTKLNSFSPGITLLNGDGPGNGGYMPYIGSALVFIPRTIVPDRPVAGSKDGSIYGHPSRIVSKLAGFESDSLNEGVSPVHITIWHFGYIGIIVFIVTVYFYIKFIDNNLNSSHFYQQVLGVSMISIPTMHTLIQSPDAMLKTTLSILLISIVIKLYKNLKKS